MEWKIGPAAKLKGEITVPPDKSISHRAVMFGSIAKGAMTVRNFLRGGDCLSTLGVFKAMGVDASIRGNEVHIKGNGLRGLSAPAGPVDLGNSGTSMRIIPGIIAGQDFSVVFTGDPSLSKRPMARIMKPLRQMGVEIDAIEGGEHAPLKITGKGRKLKAIKYDLPVASAQVKSCVLSAGLYADGTTIVTEPFQSRDHTERMLKYFGAGLKCNGLSTEITGGRELWAKDIDVPGDISSAAFFMVAGVIVEGSDVVLKNVGMNPTRRGIIDVLERMGARLDILDLRESVEPTADIRVRYSALKGCRVEAREIPLLIDEIPIILVAASVAEGRTVIEGIGELKVKETDRVKSMTTNLAKMGARLFSEGELLIAEGGVKRFAHSVFESYGDHRTAMSAAVASLISDGENFIKDTACVDTSYPDFMKDLHKLAY
ncbi:MAG TPA: 3-phosphoshikimate 1-carboxyvinyltransferase [Candidatus Omnitrophota bacterium]|nr:3-phosphoshikimate 1-carboxyvinyltransferase [Candidatus Omnitrophota bacterium]